MSAPSKLKKLASVALLMGAVLVQPGCKTTDEQWSFAVSRSVYGPASHKGASIHGGPHIHLNARTDDAAKALVVLMLLPLAVDIILLPVTLTHDLCT